MSTEIRKTPWSAYSGEDTNGWFVIQDADGHEIGSTDGGFEEEEARLFAAAPDLVEALKVARDYMTDAIGERQKAFAGYEEVGGIPQMLAELAQVDAALAKAGMA